MIFSFALRSPICSWYINISAKRSNNAFDVHVCGASLVPISIFFCILMYSLQFIHQHKHITYILSSLPYNGETYPLPERLYPLVWEIKWELHLHTWMDTKLVRLFSMNGVCVVRCIRLSEMSSPWSRIFPQSRYATPIQEIEKTKKNCCQTIVGKNLLLMRVISNVKPECSYEYAKPKPNQAKVNSTNIQIVSGRKHFLWALKISYLTLEVIFLDRFQPFL